jgi:hypothetical protein
MPNLEDKSKRGFFKKIKDKLEYFDHYLMDLTGHFMDGTPMHDHKLTSRDNLLEHSYFYK